MLADQTRNPEGEMSRPVVRTQRREQIVRAALRLVRRVGVYNVTVADVADEAGVSRGILHYHFTSKEEILHEAALLLLVEFGRRALDAVRVAGESTRAQLQAVVDASLNEDELGFYATLLEFWSPARRDAIHRVAMAQAYDGWIAFIAGLIRLGQGRGELAPLAARPEDLACALVALHDGLMVQCLVRREWMSAARARGIARALIANWFPARLEPGRGTREGELV